jgi:tRNA(Ile)-lysidine synthase
LKDYLVEKNIAWIEDPSNLQLDYDRNFIRHEVIPLLEQHWPEVSKRLLLTSRAMSDTRRLLEELADTYLEDHLAHPLVLQITGLADTRSELFKLVIRRWIKQTGVSSIPVYQLESFYQQVRQADSNHKVSLTWDGAVLRLYKQQLWLQLGKEIQPCPIIKWPQGSKSIDLGPDAGQLVLEGNPGLIPDGDFSVGARSNLDAKVIELGMQHKSLKNLFQEADIPPWLRDCIPLCKLDGALVAIGDWCFRQDFTSWLSKSGTHVSWRPKNALLQYLLSQQHNGKP